MRSNMPVTNIEYVLKDTETVVSKTDMQGNITYINRDFVNISGFSEEELLGAPQNIVRHPDMPAEAFADFWSTIKSGKAWTGLVKNRCKNGDHYWVEANAAPLTPVVNNAYGKLPLAFEANQGQTDGRVKFLARGNGYTLFLTAQEAVLQLRQRQRGNCSARRQRRPAFIHWLNRVRIPIVTYGMFRRSCYI